MENDHKINVIYVKILRMMLYWRKREVGEGGGRRGEGDGVLEIGAAKCSA